MGRLLEIMIDFDHIRVYCAVCEVYVTVHRKMTTVSVDLQYDRVTYESRCPHCEHLIKNTRDT